MVHRAHPSNPKRAVSTVWCRTSLQRASFRTALKFGQRVHFTLLRKMLKSPIDRLPVILLGFLNRPSGATDCINEVNVK